MTLYDKIVSSYKEETEFFKKSVKIFEDYYGEENVDAKSISLEAYVVFSCKILGDMILSSRSSRIEEKTDIIKHMRELYKQFHFKIDARDFFNSRDINKENLDNWISLFNNSISEYHHKASLIMSKVNISEGYDYFITYIEDRVVPEIYNYYYKETSRFGFYLFRYHINNNIYNLKYNVSYNPIFLSTINSSPSHQQIQVSLDNIDLLSSEGNVYSLGKSYYTVYFRHGKLRKEYISFFREFISSFEFYYGYVHSHIPNARFKTLIEEDYFFLEYFCLGNNGFGGDVNKINDYKDNPEMLELSYMSLFIFIEKMLSFESKAGGPYIYIDTMYKNIGRKTFYNFYPGGWKINDSYISLFLKDYMEYKDLEVEYLSEKKGYVLSETYDKHVLDFSRMFFDKYKEACKKEDGDSPYCDVINRFTPIRDAMYSDGRFITMKDRHSNEIIQNYNPSAYPLNFFKNELIVLKIKETFSSQSRRIKIISENIVYQVLAKYLKLITINYAKNKTRRNPEETRIIHSV